ncbi:hypothetical protein CEXT_501861 [Caerostris extrusa]|uniref:Epidermal retinol dehydrogenase 2 n=1 Tax=Caerostris extrusa TaxID=172846 RepID=A0AAV4XTL9_CAEEX|nr:hypothetical protein CEXT_501861 [Caerostris extrusa]
MAFLFPKELSVVYVMVGLIPEFLLGLLEGIRYYLTPKRFRHRKDISGQTVLITGAGSGIGRRMAIEFSKHKVCLVMLDLNRKSLLDTEKLLDPGTSTFIYECDVSDRSRVYELAGIIRDEVGKIDILVNNAGVVCGKGLLHIPDEMIEKTVQVNSLAHIWSRSSLDVFDSLSSGECNDFNFDPSVFLCAKHSPGHDGINKGHIVSIASLAGVSGLPNLTDYCASKFAAVGFMESLKLELVAQKLDGIKLTTVCPSLISTGLFEGTKPPLTVLMTPEYVAGEIVNAILEETEFVILPRWMYIIILFKWVWTTWWQLEGQPLPIAVALEVLKKNDFVVCAVELFYENSGLLTSWTLSVVLNTNNNGIQAETLKKPHQKQLSRERIIIDGNTSPDFATFNTVGDVCLIPIRNKTTSL